MEINLVKSKLENNKEALSKGKAIEMCPPCSWKRLNSPLSGLCTYLPDPCEWTLTPKTQQFLILKIHAVKRPMVSEAREQAWDYYLLFVWEKREGGAHMSHNTCMWGSEDSDSKLVLSFHQGFQESISGLKASTLTLWACLVVQHWTSGPIASTCQVLDYRHTHQAQYMWNRRWNLGLRTQPRGWVDMLKKHQWALENASCRVDLNSPTASPEGCK